MISIIDYAAAVRERLSDNGLITTQTRLMCGFRKWLDYSAHLLEQNRKLTHKASLVRSLQQTKSVFHFSNHTKTSQTKSVENDENFSSSSAFTVTALVFVQKRIPPQKNQWAFYNSNGIHTQLPPSPSQYLPYMFALTLHFVRSRVGVGCPVTVGSKGECYCALIINPQNVVRSDAGLEQSGRLLLRALQTRWDRALVSVSCFLFPDTFIRHCVCRLERLLTVIIMLTVAPQGPTVLTPPSPVSRKYVT